MRLISATPSPYARKVRIALAEKAIPFELVTEVPWNDDTSLPQFNPLEKLPVLILDSGETVYESNYILEWLEAKYPTPALMPDGTDARLATKKLMVLGDGVCDAFLLAFFERMRNTGSQSAPWIERQMRKVWGGIGELARLIGSRDYAVGDSLTLGDIAVCAPLGYLEVRAPDLDWHGKHPNLAAYFKRHSARPSFLATVPYPQVIRDKVM